MKNQSVQPGSSAAALSIILIPVRLMDNYQLPEQAIVQNFNKPYDSTKYHEFMQHYLGAPNSGAFLELYAFNLDKLPFQYKEISGSYHSVFGNDALCIKKGEDLVQTFNMDAISFYHNPQAELGYFVLQIKWQPNDPTHVMDMLGRLDFFRLIENNFFVAKKIKGVDHSVIEVKETKLNIRDFLIGLFPGLVRSESFIRKKPNMLHLFYQYTTEHTLRQRQQQAYQILRIPAIKRLPINAAPQDGAELQDYIKTIRPDTSIEIHLMNEGALIIDQNEAINSLIKKYTPTFLLAINQREILLQIMQRIAEKKIAPSGPDIESQEKQIVLELEALRSAVIQLQLKQIFYSVSIFDELNLFLIALQEKFRISYLLKDNKESINEVHQLIQAAQEKAIRVKEKQDQEIQEQKEKAIRIEEKKRNFQLTLLALVISALGIISTADTVLNTNEVSLQVHNTTYIAVGIATALLAVYFWIRGNVWK